MKCESLKVFWPWLYPNCIRTKDIIELKLKYIKTCVKQFLLRHFLISDNVQGNLGQPLIASHKLYQLNRCTEDFLIIDENLSWRNSKALLFLAVAFILIHNVSTPSEFFAAGIDKNFRTPSVSFSIFT